MASNMITFNEYDTLNPNELEFGDGCYPTPPYGWGVFPSGFIELTGKEFSIHPDAPLFGNSKGIFEEFYGINRHGEGRNALYYNVQLEGRLFGMSIASNYIARYGYHGLVDIPRSAIVNLVQGGWADVREREIELYYSHLPTFKYWSIPITMYGDTLINKSKYYQTELGGHNE